MLENRTDFSQQAVEVDPFQRNFHQIRFETGNLQHIVDQLQQGLAGGVDIGRIVVQLLGIRRGGLQQLAEADDRVERGADFMAHHGQEVTLGLIRLAGQLQGFGGPALKLFLAGHIDRALQHIDHFAGFVQHRNRGDLVIVAI